MHSDRPPPRDLALLGMDDDEAVRALQDAAALVRALGDDEVRRLLEHARARGDDDMEGLIARMKQASERCRSVRARADRRAPTSPDLFARGRGGSVSELRRPAPGAAEDRVRLAARHEWVAHEPDDEPITGVHRTPMPRPRRDGTEE